MAIDIPGIHTGQSGAEVISRGAGIWLCVVGAVLALVAGLILKQPRQPREKYFVPDHLPEDPASGRARSKREAARGSMFYKPPVN